MPRHAMAPPAMPQINAMLSDFSSWVQSSRFSFGIQPSGQELHPPSPVRISNDLQSASNIGPGVVDDSVGHGARNLAILDGELVVVMDVVVVLVLSSVSCVVLVMAVIAIGLVLDVSLGASVGAGVDAAAVGEATCGGAGAGGNAPAGASAIATGQASSLQLNI